MSAINRVGSLCVATTVTGVMTGLMTLPGNDILSVNINTFLLSPLTPKVHQLALQCSSEWAARGVQLLQYFAKPVDRMIQAVAQPIFALITGVYYAVKLEKEFDERADKKFILGLHFFTCPLWLPVHVGFSFISTIALVANGIFQLFVPYQAVYNVIYGKEAARAFFDYRDFKITEAVNEHKENKNLDYMFGVYRPAKIFRFVKNISETPNVVNKPETFTTFEELVGRANFPSSLLLAACSITMPIPYVGPCVALYAFGRPSLIHCYARAILAS